MSLCLSGFFGRAANCQDSTEANWSEVEKYLKANLFLDSASNLHICSEFNTLDSLDSIDSVLVTAVQRALFAYVLKGATDTVENENARTLKGIRVLIKADTTLKSHAAKQEKIWEAFLTNQTFIAGFKVLLHQELREKQAVDKK